MGEAVNAKTMQRRHERAVAPGDAVMRSRPPNALPEVNERLAAELAKAAAQGKAASPAQARLIVRAATPPPIVTPRAPTNAHHGAAQGNEVAKE